MFASQTRGFEEKGGMLQVPKGDPDAVHRPTGSTTAIAFAQDDTKEDEGGKGVFAQDDT